MTVRISILTPCFNAASTIERAIHSVQMQGYPDFEHIVVDGGSTDGTVEILKRYPHLKWISEPDRGQSDAMNKAIRMATGDVMTFLNADDEFFPDVFADVAKRFEESPEVNMVIGQYERRKSNYSVIVTPKLNAQTVIGYIGDWPANPVSYFYNAELQNRIGPFPVRNHYTMDYWWMLRALKLAIPVYSERVFGCFHSYGDNKTSDKISSIRSRRTVLMQFLLSVQGARHLPTWIKTRYWHYLYRQAMKTAGGKPGAETST